jgi:hypothetical protein
VRRFIQDKGLNLGFTLKKDGVTLYHFAVIKTIWLFIEKKKIAALNIDINAKNKDGLTALVTKQL